MLPFFLAFINLRLRYRDDLGGEVGEAIMWLAFIASLSCEAWEQFFFCHGVSMAQIDQHVGLLAVSCAKVNRLPNTAPAVNAKRAASVSFRRLNLNACSSR